MNEIAMQPSLPACRRGRPQLRRHQRREPQASPHLAQPRRLRLPDRTRRPAAWRTLLIELRRRTHPRPR